MCWLKRSLDIGANFKIDKTPKCLRKLISKDGNYTDKIKRIKLIYTESLHWRKNLFPESPFHNYPNKEFELIQTNENSSEIQLVNKNQMFWKIRDSKTLPSNSLNIWKSTTQLKRRSTLKFWKRYQVPLKRINYCLLEIAKDVDNLEFEKFKIYITSLYGNKVENQHVLEFSTFPEQEVRWKLGIANKNHELNRHKLMGERHFCFQIAFPRQKKERGTKITKIWK